MRSAALFILAAIGTVFALPAPAPWGPFTSAEDMAYFKGLPTDKCQWIAGQQVTFQFKWRRNPAVEWFSAVSWEIDGQWLASLGNPDLEDVQVGAPGPDGFRNVTGTLPAHRIFRSSDNYVLRAEYRVTGVNLLETPKIYITDDDEGCPAPVPVTNQNPQAAPAEASDQELGGITW